MASKSVRGSATKLRRPCELRETRAHEVTKVVLLSHLCKFTNQIVGESETRRAKLRSEGFANPVTAGQIN